VLEQHVLRGGGVDQGEIVRHSEAEGDVIQSLHQVLDAAGDVGADVGLVHGDPGIHPVINALVLLEGQAVVPSNHSTK
jgi:hypothetical protein